MRASARAPFDRFDCVGPFVDVFATDLDIGVGDPDGCRAAAASLEVDGEAAFEFPGLFRDRSTAFTVAVVAMFADRSRCPGAVRVVEAVVTRRPAFCALAADFSRDFFFPVGKGAVLSVSSKPRCRRLLIALGDGPDGARAPSNGSGA